ncbi:MAG: RsbRD N-terminal domain-containing protein [bacterium]
MKLAVILSEKRGALSGKWFDMIVASYPENTVNFLKKQKDQFANPVGYTISKMTGSVLEVLCNRYPVEHAYEAIDRFVRIRAVQDFSPSAALDFLPMLKQLLKEVLKEEIKDDTTFEEFAQINQTIDNLMLNAFESYMKYRERIYELKVNEFKNMAFRLLEKANLTFEFKDEEPVQKSEEDNVK